MVLYAVLVVGMAWYDDKNLKLYQSAICQILIQLISILSIFFNYLLALIIDKYDKA